MCNVSRCVFYSLEIQRNYVNQADPRTGTHRCGEGDEDLPSSGSSNMNVNNF